MNPCGFIYYIGQYIEEPSSFSRVRDKLYRPCRTNLHAGFLTLVIYFDAQLNCDKKRQGHVRLATDVT
jgi:hypothetical protein